MIVPLSLIMSVSVGLSHAAETHQAAEAKAERARFEEKMAKIEPKLAKEPWAVTQQKFIDVLRTMLGEADHVRLYRLDPKPLTGEAADGPDAFRGYKILSQVVVEGDRQRKELTTFLGKSLHWNHGRLAFCFYPRHGLRVTSKHESLDFLICYQCDKVEIYQEKKKVTTLPLLVGDANPIVDYLRDVTKKGK